MAPAEEPAVAPAEESDVTAAEVTVRPATADDAEDIRRLFRSTVALGAPLPFQVPGFGRYESLCLDWYLGPGRADAAVAEQAGHAVGFALVCTDPRSYGRWSRRRAAAFGMRSVLDVARGRARGPAGRFLRLRVRDGLSLWRSPSPAPAHAHINVATGHRAAWVGRALGAHVDDRCRAAGLGSWFGEINAPAGRRAAGLERLGGRIVHRGPNRTLTWLAGRPVERLTVLRVLPETPAANGPAGHSAPPMGRPPREREPAQ